MSKDDTPEDARFKFLEARVHGSYRHIKADAFLKNFRTEDNTRVITEFLEGSEIRGLLFYSDKVVAAHTSGGSTPKSLPRKGKCVYFLKGSSAPLKVENMATELSYGELGVEPLEQLEAMIQSVYMPMLSNQGNQEGWGDVAGKEVVEKLHDFLAWVSITYGQTRGETNLPLPVGEASSSEEKADAPGRGRPAASETSKDRIHLLESAVIRWTHQIRNVLKQDPESLLKIGQHPTPDAEITFWRGRAQNLNSIFHQLQGPKIRNILRSLDSVKSTYGPPFAKLCKEVFAMRNEANSNEKYLKPLEKWFKKLNDAGSDEFHELMDCFKPIMHLILLIWKNSDFYNTPPRLVVLMREICNALINQAMGFVSGKMIFDLIEAEETGKAVEKLKMTLKVCGTFKSTYFDYKAQANAECPDKPWRIQNNALFMRLDSFLERCHDILDLTQTIVQFEKLAKIEVGGTKGKSLTTSVQQIYSSFKEAVEAFQNVTYDIMDVGAKQFDDDFYEFRCKIKELERRLGSILTQGFDDASTITGRFKLLDSFEGLLERPIIQDELEKKHVALVQSFHDELKVVQELFLSMRDNLGEGDRDIGLNMPPSSGAIDWCNGLLVRIQEPMRKLKMLNRAVMEREEARELSKLYQTIEDSLKAYKEEQAGAWADETDTTATSKLKLTLLRRVAEDSPLLEVNFDPELVALLRETKYMMLMGLQSNVPDEIKVLFTKEETYRTWRARLQLSVNMYNNIMTTMLPVEAPLLRSHIDKINAVVEQGLTLLTWKSHGIDSFIEKAKMAIDEADDLLSALKTNLNQIEGSMQQWYHPLVERQEAKAMQVKDYKTMHDQAVAARYAKIAEGGKEIHRTLKEANKICKISQGHPEWKAYTDFVNCVLISGLTRVVQLSMDSLATMINMDTIASTDEPPVLETEINLINNAVVYVPSVKSTTDKFGIRRLVSQFVEDILRVGRLVKRLDTGEGTYVREIQDSIEVQTALAMIYDLLEENESATDVFKKQYDAYSSLWTTNLDEMFSDFLPKATVQSESGLTTLDLDMFDEKLTALETDKAALGSLKAVEQIGWLQVRSNPIKENISMCSAKWSNKFLSYLEEEVTNKLSELRTFIHHTRKGLMRETAPGDTATLMLVMGNIRDVRNRMDTTVEMLDPIKATVALLKQHKRDIDDNPLGDSEDEELGMETVVDFLDGASLKWDALVNFTFRVKENIMPLQNAEVDSINKQLSDFSDDVEKFRAEFKSESGAPFTFKGETKAAYAQLDKFRAMYLTKMERAKELNGLEELFELPITKYRSLITCDSEMKVLKGNWDFRALQLFTYASWNSISWKEIDTDALEAANKRLQKELKLMGSANSICRAWDIYKDIETSIKDMSVILPLISELHSPAMRARHWKAIAASCKVASIAWDSDSFCFKDLLDLKLQDHADDVSEQVETAEKELKIEKKLEVIESRWETLKLDFVDIKGEPAPNQWEAEEGKVYLPRPSDEVVESLEADQMELQGMIGMGKFVRYFKDRVTKWSNSLSDVEENMKDWLNVAKQWASLENIFLASADIRAQLPDDTKRFEGIDAEFKTFSQTAFAAPPLVVGLCTLPDMGELLKKLLTDLAKCQKALNEYLDTKKKIYPRFYFVSNVALLDILSNGNNPMKIMPYLSDCYDSLSKLVMQDVDAEIPHIATAMVEGTGRETVEFPSAFEIKGAVESWLNELTDVQVLTLKTVQRAAIDTAVNWEVETPRHKWLFDYPAQSVLQVTQIFWTEETEGALEELESGNEEAVKTYFDLCNSRLASLIQLVEGKLSKNDRTKIIALITMDVHSRDVVESLITEKAEGPAAFVWQKQLRNYWANNAEMDTDIRICDYKTKYTYEYIGNCGRLVITPLTDRCYITLTTAMRLMLGGAPAGPAGTGKTETTKDLARALALPCYVFNCSDQMNYQTLEDIFKGLSQSGSWGCFDEFNRIPIEVLSVVATQVKTIQDAIVKYSVPANRPQELCQMVAETTWQTPGTPPMKVGYFDFFGDELCLIPTTSFYITMNPGYAGRTELPENLKALFRSCAMIRPDLALICENMLMAEGFVNARILSIKFVTLYELSSELLSPQAHYDWGLRAVKSVLRVAGILKRSNKDLNEEPVLMRALRDFNTPKIPANDSPIFLRLISDLFPQYASTTPPVIDVNLKKVCAEVCKDMKPVPLQDTDVFVAKVVNFQELLDVRHSVMLIGCAGSGKTEIWRTLLECQNNIGRANGSSKNVAVAETVNPKSVTSDELYGYMTLSKDWKDGVLSICMRGMSKNYRDLGYYEYQSSKWVVLDGDIDAVWIESMNTVMDDNKVLTLVSNERIPLSDAMRMVFEINSLKNATPATVSRAGILYINETDIGWRPYVDSWINTLESEKARDALPKLFDEFVVRTLDAIKSSRMKYVIDNIYTMANVTTLCKMITNFIPKWVAQGNSDAELLEQYFVFACIWSFGGAFADDKTTNFRTQFADLALQLYASSFKKTLEEGTNVFDYFVDIEKSGEARWTRWDRIVEEYVPAIIGNGNGMTPFPSLFVSTADSCRLSHILGMMVEEERPVMFVGGAGTGKSVMIKEWLKTTTSSDENMLSTLITMNYYTDSKALQNQIEGAIDKRSGRRFGPKGNKKLTYFIDDINLPYIEEYGTQNSISLLKQIMGYGSFFDRADLGFKKEIVDVRYVAAMNPKAGSFTITERAQIYFTTLACMMPSERDLTTVFSSILEGHFQGFDDSVANMAYELVGATINLHKKVSDRFLPSAVKFVYNWNMRELANIFQGICLAERAHYKSPLRMGRLWVHECQRVFGDRLVDDYDLNKFKEMLTDVSKSLTSVTDHSPFEDMHAEPLVFTSFATVTSGEPAYLDVPSGEQGFSSLKKTLDEKLNEYNDSNAVMDLVLFRQAQSHICRISRIIERPSGNAMLVGVGGSGKQSLSKLAAFISGYEVKQLAVTSDFTVALLIEKLQEFFKSAGIKGNPTVWLLTDQQIVNEEFLVYINDVLANGWIPDLFPKDDLPGILDGLKGELRANSIPDTIPDKIDFFIRRIKQYLHVILCFSPVGESFRLRARRFPGLVNETVIDWFHPWPEEALVSVADRFLGEVDFASPEIKENVSYHMAAVHLSVTKVSLSFFKNERRNNYVTPKSFLEFIAFYKMLLSDKRTYATAQIERLQNGLDVLANTSAKVADLQEDLKVTMANVEEKKHAGEILMEQIGVQRADAEEKKAAAAIEKEAADKAAAEAAEIEKNAAGELAEAQPALEAAAEAVNGLSKAALGELKGLAKPPSGVDLVTKCVLMMIENEFKNFKWDRAKKMMGNVDAFLTKLKAYTGQDMDDKLINGIEGVMKDEVFTYENMLKKSSAAANLCNWVINIYRYNRIYVKVKPLMDSLNAARAAKAAAEAKLAEVMAIVKEVEDRLDGLRVTFMAAQEEKRQVEELAEKCIAKLSLANRLVGGLASENARWGVEVEKLRAGEANLVGDVLISSAFVGYIGGFDSAYRKQLWSEGTDAVPSWISDLSVRNIPISAIEDVDPLNMLTDDSKNAQMMSEGLPADRVSVENGALITSSSRWPLIIDPQEQGVKWLKGRYGTTDEETGAFIPPAATQLTKKGWQNDVSKAIEQGYPILIENLGDDIDATMDPVLARAIVRKGRNMFINFAGKEIEYDPGFKLFLLTKLSNPHYKPEIQAQCTLINFIATVKGLEDQLLARVVQAERPDKEAEQRELQASFNQYKIQLTSLEDNLLYKLANAPDDILSDIPLIEGIETTKAEAIKINEAVEKGNITKAEINLIREKYRPVAAEASMLYFMLTKLNMVNHMYQYSLDAFVQFFYKAIERAEKFDDVDKRIAGLTSTLRFTIFTWVARGLFEAHKLIFLSQLTFNLMRSGQLACSADWDPKFFDFLMTAPKKLDGDANPISEWLPDSAWTSCQALALLEDFSKLPSDLEEASPRFKDWFNHVTPETEKLPLDWAQLDRNPFAKMLVTRCLRPDRMNVAMENFVRASLPDGNAYADCDGTLNSFGVLKESFADSSPSVPIYFILSPGADVVADVDRLATEEGMEKGVTYHNVSMGQGQDRVAERLLEDGNQQGHWVILNNVHLMPKWLVKLEKMLDVFNQQGSHEKFRLFMSSDPSNQIPIGVLARCIKLSNEPPAGLKANLKRAFCSFSREFISDADSKTKAIIFGLCQFHSCMMERKKFGPKGFNMMYPFSLGDLRDSAICLTNYLENATGALPWADLKYIFGEIIYGGHIVNDFDRLLANTYLDHFMRDEILDEMELFPFLDGEKESFKSPAPTSYDRYLAHIEENIKGDTPLAFGMHPNAEIDFRTTMSNNLFNTLAELQPRATGGDGGDEENASPQMIAESITNEYIDRFAEQILDVEAVVDALEEKGPYQNVFLQECEAINTLLVEMNRSLLELTMGFAGELTMSDSMETLMDCLYMGKVPPSWSKLAYPSLRQLALWSSDLQNRFNQLSEWCGNPMEIPRVTWISGLVNPTSFLTAIKQMNAQRTGAELDKLMISTEITKRQVEDCDQHSRDGAYICGLAMQGARWDSQSGQIDKSRPKEMFCAMPVINCKATRIEKDGNAAIFNCPCYKTEQRGPTFVFLAQLKTKSPAARWIMAGVALIMDIGNA